MSSPLNTFRTITAELSTTTDTIYTAPANVTSIVLMAQAANITSNSAEVTFLHSNPVANTETELVKNYLIPGNDASSLITGKLVIETGNLLKGSCSANTTVKMTLSVLETLNA
jgi:hypothetical protein